MLREKQIVWSQALRYSLRLVFHLHIRFTAKSSAPLGSFCQSRLCSSARRIPQNRAVLASAPSGSAPLRKLTAPPSAPFLAIYETNVFYWPVKAQLQPLEANPKMLRSSQMPLRGKTETDSLLEPLPDSRKADAPPKYDPEVLAETTALERFSTPEDIARHLQITRRQVLQAARQNLLPAHPVSFGGRRRIWRFKISEVDAAIAGRTVKSNGAPVAGEGTMTSGSSRSRKEKSNG